MKKIIFLALVALLGIHTVDAQRRGGTRTPEARGRRGMAISNPFFVIFEYDYVIDSCHRFERRSMCAFASRFDGRRDGVF